MMYNAIKRNVAPGSPALPMPPVAGGPGRRNRRSSRWLVCLWFFAACSGEKTQEPAPPGTGVDSENPASDDAVGGPGTNSGPFGGAAGEGEDPPPYQPSRRNLVQWKRYAALEADLVQALDLSPDQVCREVGGESCVRDVHLVPLGGNEPYVSGLMVPPTDPLATTPTVVDRVLLSACSTRARLDAEGEGKVFAELNFDVPLAGARDPAIEPTIRSLYQRLLARDPEPFELSLVATLAEGGSGPRSAQEFAALSCFAIGSTTEFLFF